MYILSMLYFYFVKKKIREAVQLFINLLKKKKKKKKLKTKN